MGTNSPIKSKQMSPIKASIALSRKGLAESSRSNKDIEACLKHSDASDTEVGITPSMRISQVTASKMKKSTAAQAFTL